MTRSGVRKVVSAVLSYGVVGLVMWLLYRTVGNSGAVSDAIGSISLTHVLVVSGLGLVYLASMFKPMTYTLPGLDLPRAGVARTASSALANTVPEGGTVATGLTFAMYRSWGFTLAASTTSILAVGLWTNLSRYGVMAIALVVLVVFGSVSGSVVWIAVGACVVVTAICASIGCILTSDRFARALGRLLTRMRGAIAKRITRIQARDMEEQIAHFRADLLAEVRTSWRSLTATMVLTQVLGATVLGVSVRMAGLEHDDIGWDRIFVAFGAMSLAAFVAPTPGGLGVAEAALIAVLGVGLSTGQQAELVAAVLVFRFATWFLPIPIGLVSYLYWRLTTNWKVFQTPRSQPSSERQTRSEESGRA
ncbi:MULTISPECIES: lysylphosphatidylglycerol synthase transmembrane domain-containing protein [Nocardiaceae]|uniref:lysylphosphatidylglycerol synthase transmembrane domain-containing protein n=1 Tax=Nocardiaceae TaxID=85025 RepID=UPI000567D309|nr:MULTISPECIES: lysylphosphatidylglycerol synthase domain-containing protein [Rhodococcus]OZF07307.1 lysylphosphatidylglycerol synthetase family protein [Rhodococcus sp. 15-1189-1-1a]OZF22832.1 lysylphosphatidylglycerol synthetase family protein [Rhodococcus sp. 14-2686-1-2]OZF58632.1 lysylphosphatidylglycerol synthetase family protein [Rhodococcus sp. 14-2470-1b]